ncbi:MAG: type II secretion system F family protein [Anaerolineae bacterium]|nr:type II secretion system F family protein [Anaerolineae bacterium]
MTLILYIGGGLAFLLLIVGVVVTMNSERGLVEERLERFLDDGDSNSVEESDSETSTLTDWVNKKVEKSSLGDRIARDLARADVKLKTAEYISLFGITIFGGSVFLGFLGGWHPVSFLIGAVLGAFAPRYYIKFQQRQRLNKFNDQLGDMLNLMVNGLRAGYSTPQAMDAISRELPAPIGSEFRRVVREMQIGITMEAALDNLLRRIPSDDLDFTITAINVQREVGGNLAEILDSISFTIRERVRIKGEIRVMTAQVRASGTLLSLIPLGLALILWFLNREYLLSFFDGPSPLCGWGAIGLIVVMITIGYFVMMKIADIEV